MSNTASNQSPYTASAIEHILRHHADADGWITLAKKEKSGRFIQHHYRVNEIDQVLAEWIGEDTYFSQNTFYRPMRRIEYIRGLNALYVDADCYIFEKVPEWVLAELEMTLFREKIPEPNLVIFSGRGLALVWLLERTPGFALPLWQAVERYLIEQLKEWGADSRASDPARVLRPAGTINSKNGATVTVQYRHDYRYELKDIAREYLPPLPAKKRGKPKKAEKAAQVHHKLYNTYTLHYARTQDLVKLCEIREWEMSGYRETMLFLYRYFTACFVEDPRQALEDTLSFNEQFTRPLTKKEVEIATRSAEKAYNAKSNPEANRIAQEKGYPGAGYNVSNAKLISWLDITEKEQLQMQTITGRKEKYRRNNAKRQETRREAGKLTRDEYTKQASERRTEALQRRREGLSYRTIAKNLKCSVAEVYRLTNDKN